MASEKGTISSSNRAKKDEASIRLTFETRKLHFWPLWEANVTNKKIDPYGLMITTGVIIMNSVKRRERSSEANM